MKQTDQQREAARELRRMATAHPDQLVLHKRPELDADGDVIAHIRLPTSDLDRVPDGLPVGDHEDVTLTIRRSYPLSPPRATVDHSRFAGYPHVLQGHVLCLYLDPGREWSTKIGMDGYLHRLWEWFADAAAGRFPDDEALYHAVGGVLHESADQPTVVIRAPLPNRVGVHAASLSPRTPGRLDFIPDTSGTRHTPIVVLPEPLYFGAGVTFGWLLDRLSAQQPQLADATITALRGAALRHPNETTSIVLSVPNPRTGRVHVLAAGCGAATTTSFASLPQRATLAALPADITDAKIHWHPVSDERPDVTTRRDSTRPASAFAGKTVLIIGCGGLGSWIAEFIARADVQTLLLNDPGLIRGGLLVRQNFTEADIGRLKADALLDRVVAIRDDIDVEVIAGRFPEPDHQAWADADVVIDATVSNVVAEYLDALAPGLPPDSLLARVATDVTTGTLGLLHVAPASAPHGLGRHEANARQVVDGDGELEAYQTFWDPTPTGEVIPEPGCSVPTFHGAATDVATIAGALTNLIGRHVDTHLAGTHLIAMPATSTGAPPHRFIHTPSLGDETS